MHNRRAQETWYLGLTHRGVHLTILESAFELTAPCGRPVAVPRLVDITPRPVGLLGVWVMTAVQNWPDEGGFLP